MAKNRKVIMDHDGGVDDLLSLMLILTMNNVDLLGVTITPADCYIENAIESSQKILKLFERNDIGIAAGNFHGINAFPPEWRAGPKVVNALPQMINIDYDLKNIYQKPASEFIIDILDKSTDPVTILLTGPCSNLTIALENRPDLKERVEEIVWMAGAIDVVGNVKTYDHNGTAEWNVFWDPISSRKLMEYKLPLTIFPLDATNSVPVSIEFLKELAKQMEYPISNLASQLWATTLDTIPSYEFTYFMWDVLTTSYLGKDDDINFENIELKTSDHTPNAGQTLRAEGSEQWVKVAKSIEIEPFFDYLLQQFRR